MPLHFDIELDPLTYVVDVRRETTGYNCVPTDSGGADPLQRLYRTAGGDWTFQPTSRIGTQPMIDWRGAADDDGTRPLLYWYGPETRYGSNLTISGLSGSQSVYRAGAEYARIPSAWPEVWGAAIYRHADGTRKLRVLCARLSDQRFAVYQRTDGSSLTQSTNYPTDPAAWELLGEIAWSAILGSYTDAGTWTYMKWGHWNQSGTALLGMMRIAGVGDEVMAACSASKTLGCLDRRLLYRLDVSGLAGAPALTVLGPQGRFKRDYLATRSYSSTNHPTITCMGGTGPSPLVDSEDYESDYTVTQSALDGMIVAADWKGDTATYATLVKAADYSISGSRHIERTDCPDPPEVDTQLSTVSGGYDVWTLTGFAETPTFKAYGTTKTLSELSCSSEGTVVNYTRSIQQFSDFKILFGDLRYGALLWAEDRTEIEETCVDGAISTESTRTRRVRWVTDRVTENAYASVSTTTSSSSTTSGCYQDQTPTSLTDYDSLGWMSFITHGSTICPELYGADIDDSAEHPFVSCRVTGPAYVNNIPGLDPVALYGALGSAPRFTKIKWVGR